MAYISVEGKVVTDIDGAYIEEQGIRWRCLDLWDYRRKTVSMRGLIVSCKMSNDALAPIVSMYVRNPKIDEIVEE